MAKLALITGITGQDGYYLAEYMLKRGYKIVGSVRSRSEAISRLPKGFVNKVELVEWNLLDYQKIVQILSYYRPAEIYNLAAYSSGAAMFEDPLGIGEINGLAVTRLLEAILEIDLKIRFCQASSREIFGEPTESPQTELTQTIPRSPYGASKLYADSMIRIYRQRHNLFACSAILFNHESPRRNLEFVTRKITYEAVKIKLGLAHTLNLGNLEAYRDWGFAGDYVRAMWLMLQQDQADDYVVATGKVHSVREICELAFSHLDMDYRDYVREEMAAYRPAEAFLLVGCAAKANSKLNWKPEIEFKDLIYMMVDEDLRYLSNSN